MQKPSGSMRNVGMADLILSGENRDELDLRCPS
jgi:hypothetical protein